MREVQVKCHTRIGHQLKKILATVKQQEKHMSLLNLSQISVISKKDKCPHHRGIVMNTRRLRKILTISLLKFKVLLAFKMISSRATSHHATQRILKRSLRSRMNLSSTIIVKRRVLRNNQRKLNSHLRQPNS